MTFNKSWRHHGVKDVCYRRNHPLALHARVVAVTEACDVQINLAR